MAETQAVSVSNSEKQVTKLRGYRTEPWAAEDSPFKPDDAGEKRTLFKHDGDEIIYSKAFKRLSDKSQIVVKPERIENFRSRLTHTLEVNQIAESIGLHLGLSLPLINAIALGHDIGHAPFGHAGERALQNILKDEILQICDFDKLVSELEKKYGVRVKINNIGECENGHVLFHHALNSVRIVQRKLKNVSKETIDGILKHSWSPWQDVYKFGVPKTYEGQVVAIADQVAGINHDTEDILTCIESTFDVPDIYEKFGAYMEQNSSLTYSDVESNLAGWFLRRDNLARDNGWGRKYRLRKIINSIVDVSWKKLKEEKVTSQDRTNEITLTLDTEISKFLQGYEKFVREKIIKEVSWFRQRDAQAAAAISTVYNFFKHYHFSQVGLNNITPKSLRIEIEILVKKCKESCADEKYEKDELWNIFVSCAKSGKASNVEHIIKIIDYVSGMTDGNLMHVHDIAFRLFR